MHAFDFLIFPQPDELVNRLEKLLAESKLTQKRSQELRRGSIPPKLEPDSGNEDTASGG
jgi:hypothetical protein